LILVSRKPKAKAFKRWIKHEVLPSIRKHGAYMTPKTLDNLLDNPKELGLLLIKLSEQRDIERKAKEKALKEKEIECRAKEKALVENKALEITLDINKEWFSTKRITSVLKINDLNVWRALKKVSNNAGVEMKKVFDANYGTVNSYHYTIWEKAYGFNPKDLTLMGDGDLKELGKEILKLIAGRVWRTL